MAEVLEVVPTEPALRQAQSAHEIAAVQKISRLRDMETFFRSIPDRRAAAGLGTVPDNIREMAYDDGEATQP